MALFTSVGVSDDKTVTWLRSLLCSLGCVQWVFFLDFVSYGSW